MSIAIIMHDPLDGTLEHHRPMWEDLMAAFNIPHIYKVGGDQVKGFVQFGPEHKLPEKTVCVMTPAEAVAAGVNCFDLVEYSHPEECTYVFGTEDGERGWHNSFVGPDVDCVSIQTPSPTDLYAFMAATIVMSHRFGLINGGN